MITHQNTIGRRASHLETLTNFFYDFTLPEARTLLHKMMRSAFARKNILTKRDMQDLIFFKDKLPKLITCAEALAKSNPHKITLEKFFRHWPAAEWNETLDLLFYAAIYDGFFHCPPNHRDIYHYCRGLHALVNACALINKANKPVAENKLSTN